MILQELHLENYKQYGHLELSFREGLAGIIGKNGAGKSTLFEAILYCLYGRDVINQKDLIRSSFAPEKAPVRLRLDFRVEEIVYSVRRELRGRKLERAVAELYKNEELIASGAGPVTQEVIRLLNLDREAFKHSVFSGQKELADLSKAKGQERTRLVRRMLGLERLDELQSAVNSDRKGTHDQIKGQTQLLLAEDEIERNNKTLRELSKQLRSVAKQLQEENSRKSKLEAQVNEAKKIFEEASEKQNRFQAADKALGELRERLDNRKDEQERLEKRIVDLTASKQRLQNSTIQQTYQTLKKQVKETELLREKQLNANARKAELEALTQQINEANTRKREVEKAIESIGQETQSLPESQKELEKLKQDIEKLRESYQTYRTEKAALADRVEQHKAKVDTLKSAGKDGTCPTCQQPLQHAYDDVLHRLMDEVERWSGKELNALDQKLIAAEKTGQQLRARMEELQSNIQQMREQKARIPELEKQLRQEQHQLDQLQTRRTSTQAILDQIGSVAIDEKQTEALLNKYTEAERSNQQFLEEQAYIQRELPAAEQALNEISARLSETSRQLKETELAQKQIGHDDQKYQEALKQFTGFDLSLKNQYEQLEQLHRQEREINQSLQRVQYQLEQHEKVSQKIAENRSELELLDKLSELFKQFKVDILERVSPAISQYAGELFSRITKGKYEGIRVDDQFEFSIADSGVYYPIERFSGGEIDLANFCLRIAVTRSIMELNGNSKSIEFLAFDEIFGSQDEDRRHEMMLALNHLQEQFRQIYIISHIESQKDYYPNILEVRAGPEGSTARWIS